MAPKITAIDDGRLRHVKAGEILDISSEGGAESCGVGSGGQLLVQNKFNMLFTFG